MSIMTIHCSLISIPVINHQKAPCKKQSSEVYIAYNASFVACFSLWCDQRIDRLFYCISDKVLEVYRQQRKVIQNI
jgi:hypothetical protein